jgi:sensor histidine kinase YesM
MEIEKIRFGDKLNFTTNIDENLLEWPVPNMILQPLFENAVKHGVYESTSPINIQLQISQKYGMLLIEIINEYDPASNSRKGSGIGLKNISDRLKLTYSRDDLINHGGNNGVFHVSLKLPQVNSQN